MSILTSNFELKLSYQRKGGQFFMKENPIIVPVQLNQPSSNQPYTDPPSCYFKINDAEATFYNGVDKHILQAVLAEMSKHAR